MAKIDKELLKKHQFWIGLGVFVLIWLIGVIMVQASGDEKPKKDWDTAKGKIESAKSKGPKTVAYQKPWNEHGQKFRAHKDVVWKAAWEQQALIYNWPTGMKVVPQYPDDKFGATVTEDLNNRAFFRDLYKAQFDGLDQYVYPVDFFGGFDRVFPKVPWDGTREPTREEIWLAQEDFLVRREMLDIIRVALDSAALFHEVKTDPKEKLPAGVTARRVFRNVNWELTLLIKPHATNKNELVLSGQSTIKNINITQKTQSLVDPLTNASGLPFRIFQESGRCVIRVAGEPLAFESQSTFGPDVPVQPVNLKAPFNVEQELAWENSPIRRIDDMEISWPSHRTVTSGLKIRPDLKDLDKEDQAPVGAPSGAPGAPPGAPPGPPPAPAPAGVKGPEVVEDDVTPVNKIQRSRYMHVTPQCRHLPIALKLVVDQAHIQDVLAAMASSRLRVQITQVGFYHVTNVPHEKPTNDKGATTPQGAPPAFLTGPMGSGPGPGPGPGRGRRRGPLMPGRAFGRIPAPSGSTPSPVTPTDPTAPKNMVRDAARLVELTIYGIASLYERFPPRGAAPGAPPPPAVRR